ncbi:phosphatidylinositol-glycan biosynthesis class X protein [Bubalus bubalis]|uniref:phosphatidylinositol-glycan biosynthesis class X protein n=1 Tax=Bubalus bubalis TaxID=89462 RepID=UPI000DBC738A|nr:phosphatidylinositol-glycan biosynthesis class X protein [Bubalus bubalis]
MEENAGSLGGGSQDCVRGSVSDSGSTELSQSNSPGARYCACATPRSAPNREGEGRGDEGAGRRPTALPEHLGAGSPETAGSQEQCEPCARSSDRILSPRALLGRAFSGVLAAPAVAVRAVAWLLLWEAAWFTCSPATTFNNTHFVSGIRVTCSEIILRQEVLKDGFHRDLLTKVKFGESIEDLQTCRLLIKQYIPTGLFVDPYELASLRERNITEAVMVSENFNIEAPNYLSKESEVLIYARQDSQCIDCFQAFLPVHYRYHRPHIKDGETFIVVHNPDLLMYCDQEFPVLKCWAQSEVTAPCTLNSKDICQWNNMKYKSVYKNLTLQVPVGLTIHTSLVCSVTLLISILCSTLILVAVFKYGHFSL